MGSNGNYIESPVYNDSVRTLSFWHRGSGSAASNTIIVEALLDNNWEVVSRITPITTASGGKTESFEFTKNYRAIRLTYESSTTASLYIDDIKVGHGGPITDVALAEFKNLNVGNVTSYAVENLPQVGTYSYDVMAHNAEFKSKVSNRISVRLLPPAGIENVAVDKNVACYVDGNQIVVIVDEPTQVAIYDAAGRMVCSENVAEEGRFELKGGFYIVRTSSKSFKVVVK